jgi:hypothetical protein
MLDKFNGWIRAALVFSVVWMICVAGLLLYERFVTIGSNTQGPWMLFRDYKDLVFYHVQISGESFSFWLLRQRFWTTLLLPPVIVWAIAGGLVPAIRWVRNGFRT